MKNFKLKIALQVLFSLAAIGFGSGSVNGQTYKTGVGLLIDVGDGGTLVGPHVKHFFQPNHAGEAALQFGSGLTVLQAMYQYHQPISGAEGLQWYLGLGGALLFPNNSGNTHFGIVPAAGIDYKISSAPISLFADWRPKFLISDGQNEFLAARFGLGLRFILNGGSNP
ncbi:hypothetical protein [Algoriphagus resistens]|uniref:hypothetical protein n=1 Tax=Algoriphagus resistens TaxID=1750590 RepID=UPI000716B9AB|nr:hypothetical protein [Algoriphagus resistens]